MWVTMRVAVATRMKSCCARKPPKRWVLSAQTNASSLSSTRAHVGAFRRCSTKQRALGAREPIAACCSTCARFDTDAARRHALSCSPLPKRSSPYGLVLHALCVSVIRILAHTTPVTRRTGRSAMTISRSVCKAADFPKSSRAILLTHTVVS